MKNSINIRTDFKIDNRIIKYIWIIFILLIIDQLFKILAYNNLNIHQEIKIIGDWFRIRLELNDGTAYAVPFKNEADRLIKILIKFSLSIVLMGCLIYFINKKSSKNLLIGLTLCFAGTVGNLIDRIFHGVILNNSLDKYNSGWFHGRVIDMIYMPIIDTNLPNWVPLRGGERFIFFEPIYNLADLTLFLGAILTLIGLAKISKMTKIKNQ
jgi:signal peptidase II